MLPFGCWVKYWRSRVWSNQRRPAVKFQSSFGEYVTSPKAAYCFVIWSFFE